MKTFRRFIRRLSNFVLRRRSDDRLREEATWHLDILTEENLHAGMTPKEARRQAAIRFGGMNVIREEYRDEESIPALENLLLDVRYAVRVLLMSPTFCVVALLTVALGIAANVLVFGIINAAILHPLDVSDPGNLYQLRPKAVVRGHLLTTSYPAFLDFRHRASSFVDLAAYNGYSSGELKLGAGQIKVYGYEVTGNYFDVLGVSPAQGHLFHEDPSSTAGSAPSLVLSDAFWQRQFHGKPDVVGSVITVDGKPYSVIGIAPPGFHGTERLVWPDYWIRLSNELQVGSESAYLHSRTEHAVTVLGRLKPGVSPEQGSRELSVIAIELSREYPLTDSAASFRLIHPGLAGDEGKSIRGFLFALGTLVLLMLGAICANLASLSEVRLADRRRELAIRVALGTGRARLIRQLTLESLLIAIIGGGLGLLAGVFLLSFLNRLDLPLGHLAIHLEPRIYGVGVALTLVSALLFGLVPAWRATRRSPGR
ncbi:ABC transporter permease [Granulicella cerasi]|uniref:ABC transporter permease n=1 Tax=Granulicella cerasi TaxID=741063 RepID=A0ABW1Z9Z7_9BACT